MVAPLLNPEAVSEICEPAVAVCGVIIKLATLNALNCPNMSPPDANMSVNPDAKKSVLGITEVSTNKTCDWALDFTLIST